MAKKQASTKRKSAARRVLFDELMEGVGALADSRGGKRTLRTHAVAFRDPRAKMSPQRTYRSP